MKKISKILATTIVFIGIFVISALGTYTLLNNYDISTQKDIKTQLITLKENMPKAYVVQSGSMEPAIQTGSLILSLPQKNYRSGDILTFESGNRLITHRAMYQEHTLEDSYFLTKGDANEEADAQKISQSSVVGKVVLSIPKVGYLANYAKTPKGFILFVIVPATIVIYEELKTLFKELLRFIKRMKNRIRPSSDVIPKHSDRFSDSPDRSEILSVDEKNPSPSRMTDHKIDEDNNELGPFGSKLVKGIAILPIFGAILVVAAFSVSYFFDNETSTQNVFSASSEFPPSPTPFPFQGLVINEVLPDTTCSVGNTEAQWIEIYNGTDRTINPKDFMITDGSNIVDLVTANNLTIEPEGLLLLAHNNAIWSTNQNNCWDDNGVQTGNLGGQLNIDTGELQLVDPQGTRQDTSDDIVIDTVRWGIEFGLDPNIEESIERDPIGEDNVFGENFDENDFVVQDPPTPGS